MGPEGLAVAAGAAADSVLLGAFAQGRRMGARTGGGRGSEWSGSSPRSDSTCRRGLRGSA